MNETPTPGAFGCIHPAREDWLPLSKAEEILNRVCQSSTPIIICGIDRGDTMWNAFKRIVAQCSPAEKHDLFSGTARRAYRLN